MKMYDIANRLAEHLAKETGLEGSMVDRVRFGLELIFGEIIKLAILLSVATLLGFLPETLAAMAGFSLFRLVSGGPHCEDYWRCLVFSLSVFLGSAALGVYAAPYITVQMVSIFALALTVILGVMVIKWAPGEVAVRKIRPEERGLFRRLSLLFLALWTLVLVFFLAPQSISSAVAGLAGTIVQTFSFTPMGYRFMENFDIVFSKIIGERRCPNHAENV